MDEETTEEINGTVSSFLLRCTDLVGKLKLLVDNRAEKVQKTRKKRGKDEKRGSGPYQGITGG